jgi:ankyrin repeat/protein kinase domain-containing protein 1
MTLSTDFFQAAVLGDTARVQALLDHDPTLALRHSERGSTALHLAVHHGRFEVVQLLLASGARIEARSGPAGLHRTPLHEAVLMNQVEMAHLLLWHGANVQARNALGWMPLHLAVARGSAIMVRLLLADGAPADVRDGSGQTALQLAGWRGNAEVLAALQETMAREPLTQLLPPEHPPRA